MNKKLLFSVLLLFLSLAGYGSEIENAIKQRESGKIYLVKTPLLPSDTLRLSVATPTLLLQTGTYGRHEDVVEEASASYRLTLMYGEESMQLFQSDKLKLNTGRDVNISAFTRTFQADRSLESMFPSLSEITGKAELKLVLTYNVSCVYHEGHNRSATFTTEKVFNVYVCRAGTITVDETTLPRISQEGAAPVYGLYNANHGQTYTVISTEDPQIYHLGDNEYVTCSILTNNLSAYYKMVKKCSENNADYDFQFSYRDMIAANGRLNNGAKRYFSRTYSNSGFSCSSNAISIEAVDTLSLDGFDDGEDLYYVCPSTAEEDDELDEFSENVLTIHGQSVNWNRTSYSKELYDVEYGWEYHTSANATWLMVSNNLNRDLMTNPNLYLAKSFFKENLTYTFRQVVTIKKFNNWKLYANGERNSVTVKLFAPIQKKNFRVESLSRYCAGDIISDTLQVTFHPESKTYSPYEEDLSGNFLLKFQLTSSFAALSQELLADRLSIPFSFVAEESVPCTIAVEDGCHNKVQLPFSIHVSNQPQLKKEYLDVENGVVDPSQSRSNLLSILVPRGRNVKLKLNGSDPEKGSSHYYVSFRTSVRDSNGEYVWGDRSSINATSGYTISSIISKEIWFSGNCDYIKVEKEDLISGCVSEPIYVCLQYQGDILNNYIETSNKRDTVCVCKGTSNPLIHGSAVSGGYGDSTYTFVWQYSNDGQTWLNMMDTSGHSITTQSLTENVWNKAIDKTYYIRRMVTSLMSVEKESAENSAIKSFSDTLIVRPFTEPSLSLYVNDRTEDPFVCYNSSVKLRALFDNVSALNREGYDFQTFYASEASSGKRSFFSNKVATITKDSLFYAATEFCHDTLFSTNSVKVTCGANLAVSQSDLSYGTCLVRGDSASISITPRTGYSYAFVVRDDTIQGTRVDVPLPMQGSLYYSVLRSKGECVQSTEFSIQGDDMKEPLLPAHLSVVSQGTSTDGGMTSVCAGNVLSIFPDNEKTSSDISYRWMLNDKMMDPTIYTSNTLVTSGLEHAGAGYDFVRISSLLTNGKVCQTIYDTLKVHTYPLLWGGSISAEQSSLCCQESTLLLMDPSSIKGGSGVYDYAWKQEGQDTTVELTAGNGSVQCRTPQLRETSLFFAGITDKNCTSSLYRQSTDPVKVTVEKDLSFRLVVSPSTINSQSLADGSTLSVSITSEDILPTERISCWCNGKKIKSNEPYISGINHTLSRADFVDNIALFTIERKGETVASCSHTETIEVLLNEGFDGVPVVLSSASGGTTTTLCVQDTTTLSVDPDQLPKYDNKSLSPNSFDYQWYKKSGENWSICGSSSSISVSALAGQRVEYRCKLSYIPKGGSKQSVFSDSHEVIGRDVVRVGSISFWDSHAKIYYACQGATGTISLMADSMVTASSFQWYEKSGENEWSPVVQKRGTTGSDSRLCTIDLENYRENTSFKLVAVNDCGVANESDNQIQLLFNAGAALSESDIIVSSNTIYEGANLPSVSLCVPKDYKNTYFWSCNPSFASTSWHTGNPILLDNDGKGFEQGKDSVFVFMISNGYGNCPSDTIVYHFSVFEKLRAAGITFGSTPDTLCYGFPDFDANLNNITGGDGEYHADWFYKTKSMTDFLPVEATSKMPFTYIEDYTFTTGKKRAHGILSIGELEETCEFYAIVSCLGDYPGRGYWTNSYVKHVYEPLRPGDIDSKTLLLCYGDALASIKGEDATGGDGKYRYQWLKSTDRTHWEPVMEQTEASYEGQASQEAYKLYQSTYFCRVVTDSCGHSDTSSVKTVQVKSQVTLMADDILATTLVPRGDKASLWGVVNGYSYVWLDKNRMILDTTDVRGVYLTTNIDESVRTYYARVLYDGCLSTNYDTIVINTYDIDGGHLSFDSFDKNPDTDKYWICSGADAGRISADGGGNLDYRWFYMINDSGNSRSYALYSSTNTAQPVTSSSVLLDTCNLKSVLTHVSGTQLQKKVSFYRVSYFSINGEEKTENSDTISLYVVPSLSLTTALLLDGSESVAGTLIADKEIYCPNESGALIDGSVAPHSTLYELWSNGQFGPYLYDKESPEFTSWFEVGKEGVWSKEEIHSGIADYAQYYNLPLVDTVYTVRRGFSDGCSTAYSNIVRQSLSDKVPNANKVSIKGMTPEGKTITAGMELGDALSVNYTELGYDCYWFADEACQDTLVAQNQLIVFDTITAETPSFLYLKRKDNSEASCFSSALAIPLTFYTKSNGGILYKDQYVCKGEQFATLVSGRLASGYSQAPTSGIPQEFTYQWQISYNGENWMNIDGETLPDSLPASKINSLVKENVNLYYIRREAKAGTQRLCYSDTIRLQFFEELLPGEISLSVEKNRFCATDSLPIVTSTQPTGGYYGYLNMDAYLYGWEMAVNDGAYFSVSKSTTGASKSLDLEYILRYSGLVQLDPSRSNTIHIRASYVDDCKTVNSNSLEIVLWPETKAPSIYQNKETCDADAVTIKTYDSEHYTYTWMVLDEEEQVTWSYTQDSLRLQRVSEMNVTEYAVVGVQKESGCRTDYTYFNIDSLPSLHQEEWKPLDHAICYNDSITIKGGTVSGGNGPKSYQWHYSYDKKEFKEIGNEEHLRLTDLKRSLYVRRVVIDMCDTDTSQLLYIPVREKIEISESDLLFHDHVCAGQMVTVQVRSERDEEILSAYSETGLSSHYWEVDGERMKNSLLMEGFEGEGKMVTMQLFYVDTLNHACGSEVIPVALYNASQIDSLQNIISCSNLHPCNLTQVQLSGSEIEEPNVSYSWYRSDDGKEWEMAGETSSVEVIASDTCYFKRLVQNGCSSVTSNTLKIVCQSGKNYDYVTNLSLSIVSHLDADSSYVELMVREHTDEKQYVIWGDGEVPILSYGVTLLPYAPEIYKDSSLYISRSNGCYGDYRVSPLRGGMIYSNDDTVVCANIKEMPTLIATELEGGRGNYTYQWMYRDQHVKQYVIIPEAQGASYTPAPVTSRTWFKRVAQSDEYAIYSNEISINVIGDMSLSRISALVDKEDEADDAVETYSYVEAVSGTSVSLHCSTPNVLSGQWQRREENGSWKSVSRLNPSDSVAQLDVVMSDSVAYYRVVATGACQTDTTEEFKLLMVNVQPIQDGDIIVTGGKCPGDDVIVGVYYSKDYSYKYEGYTGNCVTLNSNDSSEDKPYLGDWTTQRVSFRDVQQSFDLKITRKSEKSGAMTSYVKKIVMDRIEPSFGFVAGNKEYSMDAQSVAIEQGELVRFRNRTQTTDDVTYYWELIRPLNTPSYITPYGLYSYQENPESYFYNAGEYIVSLTVTDSKGCSATATSQSLYIPLSSTRNAQFDRDAEFVEPLKMDTNRLQVFPSFFTESITISYADRDFTYEFYDSLGRLLLQGSGTGYIELDTSYCPNGCYLLKVNQHVYKLVKSE